MDMVSGAVMNRHCVPMSAPPRGRNLLSLREVVVLANVSEGRVRKDIETGVLAKPHVVRLADARLCFEWFHVFMVAAVYGNAHLNGKLRKIAISRIENIAHENECFSVWREPSRHHYYISGQISCLDKAKVEIDRFVCLDLDMVGHHIWPRVELYSSGLHSIEEREDILGGVAVFK